MKTKKQIRRLRTPQTLIRLRPKLIPSPLWGVSAYRLLGRNKHWKLIRADVLEAAGDKCEICGREKRPVRQVYLICHELWDYNDKKRTATLIGFEIHCSLCDLVTHMGRARSVGKGEAALKQMCKVNGISRDAALELYNKAINVWEKRRARKWKVRVSLALLKRYPALAVLNNYRKSEDYEPDSLQFGFPELPGIKILSRYGKVKLERN